MLFRMSHNVLGAAAFGCIPCDNGVYIVELVLGLVESNKPAHTSEKLPRLSHYLLYDMMQNTFPAHICTQHSLSGLGFVHLGT